jgi:starch-binding outer membrane protein SusE/F
MKLRSIFFLLMAVALVQGCKKYEFNNDEKGEALGEFKLVAPTNAAILALNPATPTEQVVVSWTAAKPGVNTAPVYKWVAALKTGNIDQPLISVPSDNGGKDTKLTLTMQALDQALQTAGIAANATAELIWSVVADNASVKQKATETRSITIKRNTDGLTPFLLLGPASAASNVETNPTSTTDFFTFNWTKAKPALAANATKYKVLFVAENGNFNTPLITMNADNSGGDSTLKISWKAMSDSLAAHGYADFSEVAKLQWTVVATSGTYTRQSDYINTLYITRLVRMFLVGDLTGWDINNPIELVADKAPGRLAKVFYTYVNVTTSAQFLFIKEKGNWGSKYGITGGAAPTYDIGFNTGGDFFITTPGIYRLTIDAGSLKAHIQQKQVGLVGQFQGWNPAAPNNGGFVQRDKFLILQNISMTDEFKFHDGPVWDNGTPDKARWWGKGSVAGNLDTDGNGANLTNETGTSGLTRCIWDGTNPQQVKYRMYKGQLRIVGGAAVIGNWDPNAALDMTYMGNGVWQKTVTFTGVTEFKFVSASGWDFNYGDAGGGKIGEGAGNITKTAGTYTITINEYNGTFTII